MKMPKFNLVELGADAAFAYAGSKGASEIDALIETHIDDDKMQVGARAVAGLASVYAGRMMMQQKGIMSSAGPGLFAFAGRIEELLVDDMMEAHKTGGDKKPADKAPDKKTTKGFDDDLDKKIRSVVDKLDKAA